jgi:hypothetical protein
MNNSADYPEIVYKYRNWRQQFQKDVLEKNHLFLTSPLYFNDPFDCRIPKNFLSLDTPEKIEEYANEVVKRLSENIIQMGKNVELERKKIISDLTDNLEDFHEGNAKYRYSQQDKYYGVLSLSTEWNSILMWSHYGDFHKGVCYGFWENKLRESDLFGKGGLVIYNQKNDYPSISPLHENNIINGFTETHIKAYEWQYENEYRLFKLLFPETSTDKPPSDKERVRKIPDSFFAEIILGISMPEPHKSEIIKIAEQKNIKVFQAKKNPQKFEITRTEIL